MINSFKIKKWLSWSFIRPHLCTLAVAVSFNSTWRVPREAFRYGGLSYTIALSVAMAMVALPVTLLQLSVGQLSQQDSVGVWRAVPFFRGIGYLRILISFINAVYSMIYVALTTSYFIFTLSNYIPFWECMDIDVTPVGYKNTVNASTCLNLTFMSPVSENPEYYIAVALIIFVLWIAFPFLFYNPVKLMKLIFYVLGPIVIILMVIIMSSIGNGRNLVSFVTDVDWDIFLEPDIWYRAIVQALMSCQCAGGYLISAGDSVYASYNVQWTSLTFIGVHMFMSWISLIFWFTISTGEKDTSMVAVLVQTYQTAEDNDLSTAWPLLVFAMLLISGVITMLALLYPVYDRIRRVGGDKWRLASMIVSLAGTAICIITLAGRLPALALLEDVAVPVLISIATVFETLAFVFIYGWKVLTEDIEFLTGQELVKFWVWGWCGAPSIITSISIWWAVMVVLNDTDWTQQPWEASTLISAVLLSVVVFIVVAGIAVTRQVQYDIVAKLKSSFQPSRHWGPRDPITHYYWLATREDINRDNQPRTRYSRRQLGQLSGGSSFLNVSNIVKNDDLIANVKKRSNSDDWLYTVYRKQCIADVYNEYMKESRKRWKSLDWTRPKMFGPVKKLDNIFGSESIGSLRECNNNISKITISDTNFIK